MSRDLTGLLLKTEYPPPLLGGARTYYHEILRRQRRGRFIVLTGIGGPDDATFDAGQPYAIERRAYIRPARGPGYVHLAFLLARWLVDTLRIARDRWSILLLGQVDWTFAFGPVARRLSGIPYVVFLHGEDLMKLNRRRTLAARIQRCMTRRAFAGASAIVVNARFTRREAIAFGAPAERIFVIHPGVDADRFAPDPAKTVPGDPPRLLSVGRLYERKGIDTALAAVTRLCERFPGITYEIVGEGPDRPRLEQIAANFGIADRVRFLGQVPGSSLPQIYRTADVFVLPNRELPNGDTEGFGIVFLEAAASGVPAIAGRAGGTSEAVEEGVTGLCIDPTPEALSDAVTRLLGDRVTWIAMRARARERVVREFSWNRAAEQLAVLLEHIEREDAAGGALDLPT